MPVSPEPWQPSGFRRGSDVACKFVVRLVVAIGIVFLLLPIAAVAVASFNTPPAVSVPPDDWSFESYRQIPDAIYSAFFTSLQLAVVATVCAVVICVPAAFALVRAMPRWARAISESFARSPLQVPQVIIGVALIMSFFLWANVIGVDLSFSFTGLLLAHIVLVVPYILGTLVSQVDDLDEDIERAGRGLGASATRVWALVTLPTLRQAILSSALLSFMISFDNVPLSLFLTGPNITTLPVVMFEQTQLTLTPTLYAASTLVIIVTLVMTLALERLVGLRKALGR
ncbi:MAG: hypothetical protein ABS81_04130 [Pseudonocardia sp. SCN 72-86]|nr:MAG: hypothetical protein ABS81_04130 [Pseudonocardia sp. SCN 72-86]